MRSILSIILAVLFVFSSLESRVLVSNRYGGFEVGSQAHFFVGENALTKNGFLAGAFGDQLTDEVFKTNVFWDGRSIIDLVASSTLCGVWTFSGKNVIAGNGTTLYFSPDAKIFLLPGAALALNDITLRGLRNGSFVFFDNTVTVSLAKATLELSSDMTTTLGTFYVNEESTLALRNFDFTLDKRASMTVDSVDLWLDTRMSDTYPTLGQFNAPLPMFPLPQSLPSNWSYNVSSGHLCLVNTATVRDFYTEYFFGTNSVSNVLSAGLASIPDSGTFTMQQSMVLAPNDVINVTTSMTLNGQGSVLSFSQTSGPQLIVAAGKTLTLRNIQLSRIGANTIQLGTNARIRIGSGVTWELSEDVTLTNGVITMIGTNRNNNDKFTIRGLGGKRNFNFITALGSPAPSIVIGVNVLVLQSIEFTGIENVRMGGLGQITLAGNTTINFLNNTYRGVSFEVNNLNNRMAFFQNSVSFLADTNVNVVDPSIIGNGSFIYFGAAAENHLSMQFVNVTAGTTPTLILGPPTITQFASAPYTGLGATLDLASFAGGGTLAAAGRVYLSFNNPEVTVVNQGAGSFRVGPNAFIGNTNDVTVTLQQNPILQATNQFNLTAGTSFLCGDGLNNAFDSDPDLVSGADLIRSITRDSSVDLSGLSDKEKALMYYQALYGLNTHYFPEIAAQAEADAAAEAAALAAEVQAQAAAQAQAQAEADAAAQAAALAAEVQAQAAAQAQAQAEADAAAQAAALAAEVQAQIPADHLIQAQQEEGVQSLAVQEQIITTEVVVSPQVSSTTENQIEKASEESIQNGVAFQNQVDDPRLHEVSLQNNNASSSLVVDIKNNESASQKIMKRKMREVRSISSLNRSIPVDPGSGASWTYVAVPVQYQAASGYLQVNNNGTLTQFGTASSAATTIKLNGGGKIQTPTTGTTIIKSTDSIFVAGTGNVLQVNNALVVDGNIVCKDSSSLAIQLNQGGSITFAGADGLVIGDKAQVAVSGAAGSGAFVLNNGSSITFQSQSNAYLPSVNAELLFASGAILRIKDSNVSRPVATFQGVGQVRFATGSQFDSTAQGQLILGSSFNDNMIFVVASPLTLNNVPNGGSTTVSFAQGDHGLVVNAPLLLGNGVTFEFNMLSGNYVPESYLHTFIVTAPISLSPASVFSFGSNLDRSNNEVPLVNFNSNSGSIGGAGCLQFTYFDLVAGISTQRFFAWNNMSDLFQAVGQPALVSDIVQSLVILSPSPYTLPQSYNAFNGTPGLIGLNSLGLTSFLALPANSSLYGTSSNGSPIVRQANGALVSYRF